MAAAIPRIHVAGSHREVGRAIGVATMPTLREAVAFDAALPEGRDRAEQLALATRYRDATLASTPWLVEEIDGAADGAGVDPIALFAASIEEIWSVRPSQAAGVVVQGRCSDLVAGPRRPPTATSGSPTTTTCHRRRATRSWPSSGACPANPSCSRWGSGRGSASVGTRRESP